jgi:hypothetical protein
MFKRFLLLSHPEHNSYEGLGNLSSSEELKEESAEIFMKMMG